MLLNLCYFLYNSSLSVIILLNLHDNLSGNSLLYLKVDFYLRDEQRGAVDGSSTGETESSGSVIMARDC